MHCDNLDSEELDKAYREITKEAGVSPNTIKAVLNRAGLDESTTIHSRAFELFSEGKTPLQVAITLNLEAEKTIQYHQQYPMLLGCTDVYISKGFIYRNITILPR